MSKIFMMMVLTKEDSKAKDSNILLLESSASGSFSKQPKTSTESQSRQMLNQRHQPQLTRVTRPASSTVRFSRSALNSMVTTWSGLSTRAVFAPARVRASFSSAASTLRPMAN